METKIDFKKNYTKPIELIKAIQKIHEKCNEHDDVDNHYFIDEDYQDFSDTPCAYTAMLDERVVGFLCPYIIDQYNVEFCVFVLPDYRRQSIASKLFFQMVTDFGTYSYRTSIHPDNNIGKEFLGKMGFTYGCRECSMKLSKGQFKREENNMKLQASKQDDKILISGLIDDIEVGHLELTASQNTACIHDVEIEEKLRRNGYGYQMLNAALDDIFEKYESVLLHVTKENKPAYQLYLKTGFEVLEELDYYEL